MNLALLIASIVASVLAKSKEVPEGIVTVVGDIASGLAALFAALHNSEGKIILNPSTELAALGAVIQALKSDPNLPKNVLDQIASFDRALQSALLADKLATTTVDYSKLLPISPIP
jgi:hypothetical protein